MTSDQPHPTVVKPSEVFGGRKDQVGHFRFSRGLFISVYNSGRNTGFAIQLTEAQVTSEGLSAALKKIETAGLRYTPDCAIKLVGTEKLLDSAKALLLKLEVAVKSSLIRQLEAEIFFYPQIGRIRVSAETTPVVAKIAQAVQFSKDRKIRVLIIDDSKSMQQLLGKILSSDPYIEVVGAASLPSEAEGLIARFKPDVLTMDIHMPEMDGVRLVQLLMPKYFIPTVMISSVSLAEGPLVLAALEVGAVDYIQKPVFSELEKTAPVIIEKVKNAALANTARLKTNHVPQVARPLASTAKLDLDSLIAIGSSTGGTEALRVILTELPKEIPPILIVQHIPAVFSLAFANRMNDLCPFEVKEAVDGDLVLPGRVLIAPGGFQMRVKKLGGSLKVVVTEEPPFNRHRPSVDILFDSVAAEIKRTKLIGVILTGMGADGAKGLLKLKQAGAKTIAQSKETCVVFGMPNEAIQIGAADQVVDLHLISNQLLSLLSVSRAA